MYSLVRIGLDVLMKLPLKPFREYFDVVVACLLRSQDIGPFLVRVNRQGCARVCIGCSDLRVGDGLPAGIGDNALNTATTCWLREERSWGEECDCGAEEERAGKRGAEGWDVAL
jgi:hypothetical protein